jgi:hypothetical protein
VVWLTGWRLVDRLVAVRQAVLQRGNWVVPDVPFLLHFQLIEAQFQSIASRFDQHPRYNFTTVIQTADFFAGKPATLGLARDCTYNPLQHV